MSSLFTFDPAEHAAHYAEQGYVHIRGGLDERYHAELCRQVEAQLEARRLEKFAIGNKQQALYDFPQEGDYHRQLLDGVGGVTGLAPSRLVLAERHIKAYDSDADPNPMPHKDRYASEVSVGFSIRVSEAARLLLYPRDDVGVNPFNSWAELRESLPDERKPANVLREAEPVVLQDRDRDVVMFRGNALWHLRTHAADTVMLYLKLNTFNCDPLGEDPFTDLVRERTLGLAELPDEALDRLVPVLGRRVDYVHRRYDRDWNETLGVVLAGQPHRTLGAEEFAVVRAADGRRRVGEMVAAAESGEVRPVVRRLARLGVFDLVQEAP